LIAGILAIVKIYGKEAIIRGQLYMHIDRVTINYNVKKSSFRISDEIAPGLSNIFGNSQ
jgi:hypothetical protein